MPTILRPCRVPWVISPSTGGVTLIHAETDVSPECSVVFGGGRLQNTGKFDSRRIELVFESAYYARTGEHTDWETVKAVGYAIEQEVDFNAWVVGGNCPNSQFYVASQSDWIEALPDFVKKLCRHYVIDGRNGYVEVAAQSFCWREWNWTQGKREDAVSSPVIGQGEGIE